MFPVCDRCAAVVVDLDDVVLHRNPDDGFALYAYRCPACGHRGVGGDREVCTALRQRGARTVGLRRTDLRPVPGGELAELRSVLDRDDWADVLHRLG